ncbi:cytochrome b [Motiliproteus coralliicola]|uniref:Cytochrome b n=1 Tax=Motiliproteus coralliicola TaxID=2283196 RepID=A0A369WA81_9GAMM|nr:cytochrome b [Motiliproteus coralliicola]RDE18089.1 cytochrome b [Motiliproteus coralliicola]
MLRNTKSGYGWVAITFHWLSFALLILLTLKGLSFEDMPKGPEKLAQIGNHKSMGTIFMLLILARLGWRAANPKPTPLGDNAKMNRISAMVSGALYGLLLIQPLSGALMSQAKGYPVQVFNLFEMPILVGESETLAGLFSQIHHTAWMLIVALVLLHVVAALKHHFVARNDTLKRIFVPRRG